MSEYDIKLDKKKLIDLFRKNEGLGELLGSVLNQVLESQITEHLGAERYEHQDDAPKIS